MNQEKIVLELPNKMVVLILTPFDTDVDVQNLLEVQHHNIYGELVTISVLMNRVGNMKAEMAQIISEAKLDFDIFYAQMQEEKRKELTFSTEGAKGAIKIDKPTISEVESAITRTPEYKVKKQAIFKKQLNADYIDSLHESVKNKSFAIMKISDKLRPEEFEKNIVEGVVNGIQIKIQNKSIK